MNGGPFYSAGYVRIVNDVRYKIRFVSYAHWVSLMNGGHSLNHVQVHLAGPGSRRKVWTGPESGLDAFLEQHSSSPAGAAARASQDPENARRAREYWKAVSS